MSARLPRLRGVRPVVLFLTAALAVAVVPAVAVAGTDVDTLIPGFEPHTAVVNPQNPAQVAVGQGCTIVISNDFGATFPITRNTTLGCNGDISLAFDTAGRLFATHLSRTADPTPDNELTVVAGQVADTTTAGNQTYTPAVVSADDGNDDDKQWLVADANPGSPFADNLYLVWTRFTGNPGGGPTAIQFSRSTDQGVNWSAPQTVSPGGEGFVWPSHSAVAANGDVYLAYHTQTCGGAGGGTIELLRDGTGGASFAAGTVPQKTQAFTAGQAQVTCNDQDGSGDEIPGTDFWLQGTVQPWILPDPARPGNVYVVANDDPDNAYASGDDADVVIARSTDHGASFTTDRVDHQPGFGFAVMPTAAIDQDGNVAVHWYDNRRQLMNSGANGNGAANFLLDVYGTTSNDGAQSFTNDYRLSDAPFDPDVGSGCRFGSRAAGNCAERIGEYNGVWSVDGLMYSAWTGNTTPPAAPFPADGAGGQTTYFDLSSMLGAYRDRFEPNESRDFAVVAALGANATYNQSRLTLHGATDVDVFQVDALTTGTLRADVSFNQVVAGLEARAFDAFGNLVGTTADTTVAPGNTVGSLAIPVVAGGTYFIDIRDPNAPATFAPQSTYELTITNVAAPVPFGLDLPPAFDSGRFHADDVTNVADPTIRFRIDDAQLLGDGIAFSPTPDSTIADDAPGYKVRVLRDGNSAGWATPVAGQPGVYEFPFSSALADGTRSLTARVVIVDPTDSPAPGTDHSVAAGGESGGLNVLIDTVAPTSPTTPDLLASSDSGGVNVDNVTTFVEPAFDGLVEEDALVRLMANGDVVGGVLAGQDGSDGAPGDGMGTYEVRSDVLTDDVYSIRATAEDLAGNTSAASAGLQVVVANQVLNLSGLLAATSDVTVDLEADTVAPFPVPGGVVGVRGIPTVNLDASGNDLTTMGTSEDDSLSFTPTGADSGRLTRSGSAQLLRFASLGGTLSVDPLAGVDEVQVVGTAEPDTITGSVDSILSLQVAAMKELTAPSGTTEVLSVRSRLGVDSINLGVMDSVSQRILVDGGDPLPNKPNGDELNVTALSDRPKMQNMNGPDANGSAVVGYPRTTGAETRIDYVQVEKVRLLRK